MNVLRRGENLIQQKFQLTRTLGLLGVVAVLFLAAPGRLVAQSGSPYAGSVPVGTVQAGTLSLSLDEAIQRGLKNNLGQILSGTQTAQARAQQLSQLQSLLPAVDASIKESVMQVDLPAQGMRMQGFPTIIGPFGFMDLRASLAWSLVDLNSLHSYMAARHNFAGARLAAEDARQMVILTVGNAYLLVIADQTRIESVEAQVRTAQVSLDQAVASHQAGTAPLLDELRARVDKQSLEQQLIQSRNALEKDKLALARAIGLPVGQSIELTDKVPFSAFDAIDVQSALAEAQKNRKDLASLVEQLATNREQTIAAKAGRLPTLAINADYGDIGVNLNTSHGTGNASATLSAPVFNEFAQRGHEQQASAAEATTAAQLSDRRAQVEADVRDALLDIESAQKQVEVAHSSVELSTEALSEAQQRYAAGVSDNLAVSQAEQSLAQANDQYVSSLYRHNVAKLALARALGAAENYKNYLGGK